MYAVSFDSQQAFASTGRLNPTPLSFGAVQVIRSLDQEPGRVCLRGTTQAIANPNDSDLWRSQSIIWDEDSGKFMLQYGRFYRSSQGMDSIFYRQELGHGTVLNRDFISGAIIDQQNGEILLPNGVRILGTTGEIKHRTRKTIVKP